MVDFELWGCILVPEKGNMQEISNLIWPNIDVRIMETIGFVTQGEQNYDHFETPLLMSMDFCPDNLPQLIFDSRPEKWRIEGDFGLVLYQGDKDTWNNDGAYRKLVLYYLQENKQPFEIASVCYLKRISTEKLFRSLVLGQTIKEGRVFTFESVVMLERVCTMVMRFAHVTITLIEKIS